MKKLPFVLSLIVALSLLTPATSPALDFGGPIEADLTWSVPDSPVHLTSDVRISEGATLTIEFGVEVHLDGSEISTHWPGFPWGYLSATGALFYGSGGPSENIFIRPSDHVEYCSFFGVRLLLNDDGGTLQNCHFNTSLYGIMVQGEWAIKTCIFEDCAVGIWQQGNHPVSVRNCNFIGGDEGFHFFDFEGFPEIDIRFNNFLSVGYGIFIDGNPLTDFIDARQNYWGDPSGPTHVSNPGGTGAPVGEGVQFVPWLIDNATEISNVHDDLPAMGAALHQNTPNPFNPSTTIAFDLPRARNVKLEVFSLLGRQVATLVNGPLGEGHHVVIWRGRDDSGFEVASGTYFYRLEAGNYSETKRMALIK